MKKWIVYAAALAIIAGACFYIYKTIFPPEPTQIVVTDLALEQAKQKNEEMKRRLDELEKELKQESQAISTKVRQRVNALPPDAVADAIADELRLFLDSERDSF